jgi:hypothetical protein
VQEYLDSLGERQRRELSGVRDRLSVRAESDIAPWLEPTDERPAIDLREAVRQRAVVYFALEADRRPLLARMLGAAHIASIIRHRSSWCPAEAKSMTWSAAHQSA